MRFIVSALLASALLGTMATVDANNRGQTSFHLEPRHVHQQNKVSHNHHHQKSASKKDRRDMPVNMIAADDSNLNLHSKTKNHRHGNSPSKHLKHSKRALGLHRKKSSKSQKGCNKHAKRDIEEIKLHRKKSSQSQKKNSSCNKHAKRGLDEMKLHRKKSNHSSKKSSECHMHQKRDVENINLHHKKSSGCSKHAKRDLENINLHRKNNKSNKKASLGCKKSKRGLDTFRLHRKNAHHKNKSHLNKIHKRAAPANVDTELAFHRKISRNRKSKVLGKNKNLIKTQDMKNKKKSSNKQNKHV
ncbi:hypothetical protein BGZ76_003428 [Entomortierella beljakovae]|nr:hypothetical protein BGZ76_003428 [Entomortierella beljakovae]